MTGGRLERYGPHPDQWVEWWSPDAPAQGTAVLIHGGYWRARYTADLMLPLVSPFTSRGWTVANLEYRRAADGWAALKDDLAAGLAAIRSAGPFSEVTLVGHSVGGQLALLGGEAGDAVVALAPVTDLARAYAEGNGGDAVAEFLRGSPAELPEVYAEASPLAREPSPAEVLIVHGRDDDRVPVAHSRAYAEATRAAGGRASVLELDSLPHLDAIAPDAPHWNAVHAWLDEWDARR
ncbi:alpha/beta hydrolase [Herbiconiux sp. CPCC 205716]|uniref:Alpha/beta hydrolase n=1 Tax=Herbiconiux gentiana TaxID=2970912 RepID=A0ABT2GGZ8_9MICO|nr:alpha/beta hydrolase [Herbiconiux gentiana]MCS5714555.1 alpha/beta hydrolase [Herbiconiux gentiana]